nr:monodehydroascorbate reductase [Tanacetum cinerariifolium]
MADVNVNAPADQAPTMAPPTRTDDQILPHIRWTGGCYKCQLDDQWFDLTKDTLRDALQITPVNNNKAFSSPSSSDALINFVNELGYPKLVRNFSNVVTNDMFQPCRALTAIINLCLTRKTSGFERLRALVLQILWGVVTRAHLDYAERIWEEFTLSIHTFIEDKKNLAHHTHEKKKATLIVIPSIRFTKLIIYHLQRKHKFHPRLDSPLYLPKEELVLRYLKFSAKGTKREVFGMHIPGNLITADIQGESYYQEYLAKVAKHQRYLASETGSDPDSPTLKPTKTTKKSKLSAPKAALRPPVTKPASSQQPEPQPVPAKSQGKKRIPEKEPRVDDEEADVQRALDESLKSIYDAPRGPLPPMVIREPESGKYQSLPETPKKKSPGDQYIFQRRTSTPTGSSSHDESSSLYAELRLMDNNVESDEDVVGINAGVQGEGQAGSNPNDQDEGQAGPNPDEQAEGQARPNPSDAAASQPLPSPVVHAGPNLEHMDLKVADVSTQPHLEQMDEGFTATAYPKVWLRMFTHEDHMMLYEALEKSMNRDHTKELAKDLAEPRKKKKKRRDSPKMPPGSPPHQPPPPPPLPAGPSGVSGSLGASGSSQVPPPPPPPPSTNQKGQSHGSAAPSSLKTAATAEYQARTTTDTRLMPSFPRSSMSFGAVLGVACSSHSFYPQKHQSFGKYQHYPSSLDESMVPSFNNTVLLGSSGNCLLVKNADAFIIFSQSMIDEFCAIISAGVSNSFIETDLNLLDKFDDNFWSFIFRSQNFNPEALDKKHIGEDFIMSSTKIV